MQFAEVAVDFPDEHTRTFTYSVSDDMEVLSGDLVWVPFGSRTLRGVVFELTHFSNLDFVRPISMKTIGGPFISEHLLRTARWVAVHYRTNLFTACSLLLPPGGFSRLKTWLTLGTGSNLIQEGRDSSRRVLQTVEFVRSLGRAPKTKVVRRLGRGGISIVDRLIRNGVLESESQWEKPRVSAVFANRIELVASPGKIERLIMLYSRGPSRRRGDLLSWFRSGEIASTKKALNARFGFAATKWAFDEKLLSIRKIRRDRNPLADYCFQQEFAHTPTETQKKVIDSIVAQIVTDQRSSSEDERKFLLHGVTGSGKTEVYLQAIEACLAAGKKAIFLVPEISLTPQILRRISARFPGKIAILHSGLTVGQRYDQWWRVKNGDFPIVLGSRGAVFAPVDDIGLIVIDEEHEWTYKQSDQAPRYHARAVAERIVRETGATLVLGSATPEISSYRAAKSERYRLLELPDRIGARLTPADDRMNTKMPKVQIVDMREERAAGHFEMFSRMLIKSMRIALEGDGRVILFLNRRGSASFVQCVECGKVRECKRCNTALIYHRISKNKKGKRGRLLCHHCNYSVSSRGACPVCSGKQMRRSAPGTQMAAQMVKRYFPGIEVVRWDSDSARTAADHRRIMDEFVEGDARVLVGTQMVAKGLDIPSVKLVGVISADTGLGIPDFRAGERSFQVLAQVVGRTGRGPGQGSAVIQTFDPDHYAIQAAADQDYEEFYETEIRLRANQANPPFTDMIRLMHSDEDKLAGGAEANRIARELQSARGRYGETSIEVLGPSPSFPFKMRNRYRWQILLKGQHPERLLGIVGTGSFWTIDIDPVSVG